MKLSISNIAWDPVLDAQVLPLLQRSGYSGVELAPRKYFPDIRNFEMSRVREVRTHFESYSITPIAFQAVLFGENHLKLFETAELRDEMRTHLERVLDLAGALGVGNVVFGSPKNRAVPEGYAGDPMAVAVEFFGGLARHARAAGTRLCIEANPPVYGGNFVTTAEEAAALVRAVDDAGFGFHLDSGAVTIDGGDMAGILARHLDIIPHYHASEPMLVSLDPLPEHHAGYARALREADYDGYVSIEMTLPPDTDDDARVGKIDACLRQVAEVYGPATR